jgi:PAS domain S-box-containing protein
MVQTRFFDDHAVVEALFDALPDVVFFLKDATGRYVVVNRTLADRCAGGDKARLLGRRPADVFPEALAASYVKQDESVLRTGRTVEGALELHLYPGGVTGWCLTTKLPLRDREGRITGVAGISRDLNAPGEKANGYPELASVLERMRLHFDESLRIEELAAMAGFSVYQFEKRVRRLFQMSPLQLLHKLRLDEATRLLRETPLSLGEIALRTGWCDQSAFTRHFSRYAGIAPGRYRTMAATDGTAKRTVMPH